jgi:hypothetical protein
MNIYYSAYANHIHNIPCQLLGQVLHISILFLVFVDASINIKLKHEFLCSIDYWYKYVRYSLSAHFGSNLKAVSISSFAVLYWVELKARN